jgi:hypothetical protein
MHTVDQLKAELAQMRDVHHALKLANERTNMQNRTLTDTNNQLRLVCTKGFLELKLLRTELQELKNVRLYREEDFAMFDDVESIDIYPLSLKARSSANCLNSARNMFSFIV